VEQLTVKPVTSQLQIRCRKKLYITKPYKIVIKKTKNN